MLANFFADFFNFVFFLDILSEFCQFFNRGGDSFSSSKYTEPDQKGENDAGSDDN